MHKYLAAICFLAASALVCLGISGADSQSSQSDDRQESVTVRYDPETARSSKRVLRTKRVAVVTEEQRQEAKEALVAASEVQPDKDQRVVWSERNFKYHVLKLKREDAQSLIIELLSLDMLGVHVMEKSTWEGWWTSSQTNHFKLISGLMASLAKEDFVDTVRWLDSLPSLEKNIHLARVVYNEALLAGATQDPAEAWRVYQEKCPPWGG